MRHAGVTAERPGLLRSVVACNLGVCLEGFDFIAYSAFSPIIAKLYFPAGDPLTATLLTFAGFGTAYLARPFGGLFWGLFADRHGRRAALAWVSIVTAIGTLMLALAPPYAVIGMAAPLLILVARLLQGFAASGEFASATAMLVELAPPGRKSFFASTQMASQVLTAGIAAGIVLTMAMLLTPAAAESWGWRAVFGLGSLIGPLGLYMRTGMAESPEFAMLALRHEQARSPLRSLWTDHRRALAGMAGLIVISSAALYLILIFLPLFAVRELGLPSTAAQLSTIIAVAAEAVVILAAGALADRVGPLRVLLPVCIAYALLAYPLFAYLVAHPSSGTLVGVQLAAAMMLGAISGPLPSELSALLPAAIRSTGLGLVYNLVGSIFGGLGPFLITAMIGLTGDKAAPAYWAAATGAVGAIAVAAIRFRHPLRTRSI